MNELSQLGQLFGDQIQDMKGKVKAETLPCPTHGTESEKLGTYASFPSSFTEYGCSENHTFKVQVWYHSGRHRRDNEMSNLKINITFELPLNEELALSAERTRAGRRDEIRAFICGAVEDAKQPKLDAFYASRDRLLAIINNGKEDV